MTKPDSSYSLKIPPTADVSISTNRTSILHRKPKNLGAAQLLPPHLPAPSPNVCSCIQITARRQPLLCPYSHHSCPVTINSYLHHHSNFLPGHSISLPSLSQYLLHSAARHSLLKSGSNHLALLLQIFPSSYFLQIRDLEPQVVILDLITGCPCPHKHTAPIPANPYPTKYNRPVVS